MFSLRERQSKVPLLVLQCEWFLMSGCLYSDLCFSLWFNQWTNTLHFSALSVFHSFLLVFDWSFGPSKSLKATNHWESNGGLVDHVTNTFIQRRERHMLELWSLLLVEVTFLFYYYSNSTHFWLFEDDIRRLKEDISGASHVIIKLLILQHLIYRN